MARGVAQCRRQTEMATRASGLMESAAAGKRRATSQRSAPNTAAQGASEPAHAITAVGWAGAARHRRRRRRRRAPPPTLTISSTANTSVVLPARSSAETTEEACRIAVVLEYIESKQSRGIYLDSVGYAPKQFARPAMAADDHATIVDDATNATTLASSNSNAKVNNDNTFLKNR